MRKLVYTIVLLAGFQFVQAQSFDVVKRGTSPIKEISLIGNVEETAVPIKANYSFLKEHKKMDSVKVLSGLAIMKELACTDSLKSYTATPQGGTAKYITATGPNGFWDAIGMNLPFKTHANISGSIVGVVAYINSATNSNTGTCTAAVYSKTTDTTYSPAGTSNPVALTTVQTNVTNGSPTTFIFATPINITNDILVVLKTSDANEGILLYTTKDGCAVDGSWLTGIKNNATMQVRALIKDNAFNAEGFLFVAGAFFYNDDILNNYVNINESNMELVKLYPNPVNNSLKIDNLIEATNISIYNVMGQVVRTIPSATGSIDVNMDDLSNGLYFVRMQNGKNVRTEKIQVVK